MLLCFLTGGSDRKRPNTEMTAILEILHCLHRRHAIGFAKVNDVEGARQTLQEIAPTSQRGGSGLRERWNLPRGIGV